MATTTPSEPAGDRPRWSLLIEFYIEVLGSLVPGLLAVILVIILTSLTWDAVVQSRIPERLSTAAAAGDTTSKGGTPPAQSSLAQTLLTNVNGLHYEFALLILVAAYVLGSVLFRQDPKLPDAISAYRVWLHANKDDRAGLAVRPRTDAAPHGWLRQLPEVLACVAGARIKDFDMDTQWPYPHLRCYLVQRGLVQLADLVPWCPHKGTVRLPQRSKTFVNILKIRIYAVRPDLCRDLIRNEAHIRLATSIWFGARLIKFLACVCGAVGVLCWWFGQHWYSALVAVVTACLIWAASWWMQLHVIRCLHYMRVREIVYVLETARLANVAEVSPDAPLPGCGHGAPHGPCPNAPENAGSCRYAPPESVANPRVDISGTPAME